MVFGNTFSISGCFALYFFSMDKILLLIAFVTPLSIYLVDPEFNLGISIPAEPLMFGVLIIVILKLIGGFGFDQKIIRHPLSLSVSHTLVGFSEYSN